MNEMHGNERALKNKNRHIADDRRGDQWELNIACSANCNRSVRKFRTLSDSLATSSGLPCRPCHHNPNHERPGKARTRFI
jgi:hypothetical protein